MTGKALNGQPEHMRMMMSKEQPKALRLADAMDAANTNNAYSLLVQMAARSAAAELRRLAAVEQELEALKRAISEAEPVAWIVDGQTLGGGVSQYLAWKKSGAGQVPAPLRTDPTLLYTLKGIK